MSIAALAPSHAPSFMRIAPSSPFVPLMPRPRGPSQSEMTAKGALIHWWLRANLRHGATAEQPRELMNGRLPARPVDMKEQSRCRLSDTVGC